MNTTRFLELSKEEQISHVRNGLHELLVERSALYRRFLSGSRETRAKLDPKLKAIQRRIEVSVNFIKKVGV